MIEVTFILVVWNKIYLPSGWHIACEEGMNKKALEDGCNKKMGIEFIQEESSTKLCK